MDLVNTTTHKSVDDTITRGTHRQKTHKNKKISCEEIKLKIKVKTKELDMDTYHTGISIYYGVRLASTTSSHQPYLVIRKLIINHACTAEPQ